MKKVPIYSVPLRNPAAEADAQLVARVLNSKGKAAAEQALFMVAWLSDAVRWEVLVLADRAKFIAGGAA